MARRKSVMTRAEAIALAKERGMLIETTTNRSYDYRTAKANVPEGGFLVLEDGDEKDVEARRGRYVRCVLVKKPEVPDAE